MRFLLFIGLILGFYSCQKWDIHGLDTSGTDAEYAIPVLEGKTSLQDILTGFDNRAFFEIAPNGQIGLYYKGNIQTRSSNDVFASIQQWFAFPIPLMDTVTRLPVRAPSGVVINKTFIKTGDLNAIAWLPSQFNEPLDITFFAPQLTKNGLPFQATFVAQPNAVLPNVNRYDIAGYVLAAHNDSIFLHYEARKRSTGERVVVPFSQANGRGLAMQLANLVFSYTEGFFGNSAFQTDRDTIEIDFFENWKRGEVKFVDPSVDITVDNSFGFPVKAVARVADIITIDGNTLSLRSSILNNLYANYPSFAEIGQIKRTRIHFDRFNSNIDTIINSNPAKFDYWIEGLANPDTTLRQRGFMTDSSFFKMLVEIRLPIWGTVKDFEVSQSHPLNLNKYDNIKYVELKVRTENELPLQVGLQGYFMDNNNNVIDSLYGGSRPLLEAAPVDATGNVIRAAVQSSWIRLDEAKFQKVRNCTKMSLKYAFVSSNNGTIPVYILQQQHVKVQMGMKVGLK